MKTLLLGLFFCAAVSAQPTLVVLPQPGPFTRIRTYLELTEVQFQTITRNNSEYSAFVQQKQTRMSQVRLEIFQQTAASPLDPQELGVRYAELETICRQLKEKATEVSTGNVATLTGAQKARLTVLEDVIKLLPAYNEAQGLGLVTGTATADKGAAFGSTSSSSSFADFLLGGIPYLGCSGAVPVIRSGDLTFQPQLP